MTLRRALFIVASPLSLLLMLGAGCDHFDSSTNIGSDLINALDSTIATPGTAIKQVAVRAGVDSVGSARDTHNQFPSLYFYAGRFGSEYAYAYFEFDSIIRLAGKIKRVRSVVLRMGLSSENFRGDSTSPVMLVLDTCQRKSPTENIATTGIRSYLASLTYRWVAKDATHKYEQSPDSIILDPSLYESRQESFVVRVPRKDSLTHTGPATQDSVPPDTVVFDTTYSDTSATTYPGYPIEASELGKQDSAWVRLFLAQPGVSPTVDTVTIHRRVIDTVIGNDTTWATRDTTLHLVGYNTIVDDTTPRLDTTINLQRTGTIVDTVHVLPGKRIVRIDLPDSTYVERIAVDTVHLLDSLVFDTTDVRRIIQGTRTNRILNMVDSTLVEELLVADSMFRTVTIRDTAIYDTVGRYLERVHFTGGMTTIDTLDTLKIHLKTRFFSVRPASISQNGLVRINRPTLVVNWSYNPGTPNVCTADSCIHPSALTQASYMDYHVFEDSAAVRSSLPLTSAAPLRYATVKLNLADVWAALRDSAATRGFRSILAATAIVPASISGEKDTARGDLYLAYSLKTSTALDSLSDIPHAKSVYDSTEGLGEAVRLNLRSDLDSLFNGGQPLAQTAYLRVAVTGTGVWRTLQLEPARDSSKVRFEVILTNPTRP
jgi:hypothetical protein